MRVQLADVTTSVAGQCPWPCVRRADRFSPLSHQVLLGQMEDLAEMQLTAIERQSSKFENEDLVLFVIKKKENYWCIIFGA